MNGPTNKEKIGLGLTPLQIVIFLSGLVVVLGLLMEGGPEIVHSIKAGVWPTRQLIGDGLVTIGVFFEVALALFVERSAKRGELQAERTIADTLERATRAEQATAEANLARGKLEGELLRTIGPRKLTPEQREHIAFMARELLPDTSFAVFVLSTPNAEEMMECIDFAWDISDAFTNAGKEAPVLSLRDDSFGAELNDIWVAVPPGSDGSGRAVFSFLMGERLKVVSCVVAVLPPVLYRTERNGRGVSMPLTDDIKKSIGIVVAKRSQPIFRLETRSVTPPQA